MAICLRPMLTQRLPRSNAICRINPRRLRRPSTRCRLRIPTQALQRRTCRATSTRQWERLATRLASRNKSPSRPNQPQVAPRRSRVDRFHRCNPERRPSPPTRARHTRHQRAGFPGILRGNRRPRPAPFESFPQLPLVLSRSVPRRRPSRRIPGSHPYRSDRRYPAFPLALPHWALRFRRALTWKAPTRWRI